MKGQKPGLHEIFDDNASNIGPGLAVKEDGKDWSYDELLTRSEDLSNHLISLRIIQGHRVALMLPNSGAFVMAFFSISRVGAIVVPFNNRYQEQELTYYIEDISPSAIVMSPDAVGRVKKALAKIKYPPILIEASNDGSFRMLQGGEEKEVEKADLADPPVLLQFTSGSTGEPKRVLRTHGQLLFELRRLSEVFGLGEGEKYLGAAPFSHVNGLVRTMLLSMFGKGTLYPLPNFNRREILGIISQERITYFGAVPYMYITLTVTPLRGAVDLSSIRTAFSSSAPLLPEDNRAFKSKFGFFIRQLYGSTETGTISVNSDQDLEDSLESVGQPLDGVRVEIFDNDGTILGHGHQGEVGITSPAAITAYENNPTANAQCFRDDFYLSGDLGFKDDEGRLTLTGRKKFLINRGGYEVNPSETEKAILGYGKVEEVVVFGVPTRHGDQSIKSLIVVNAPCTEKEIIEHCRSMIADYKVPGTIEFVKSLPKSQTGKILRDKCS